MKFKTYLLVFISYIFFTILSVAYADVNLYQEPRADAKIIGTINLSDGIVPIIKTSAGDWVKVGDRRNGEVGWIKTNELQNEMMKPITPPANSITPTTKGEQPGGKTANPAFDYNKVFTVTPQQIEQAGNPNQPNVMRDLLNNMNQVYQKMLKQSGQPPSNIPFGVIANPPNQPQVAPVNSPTPPEANPH